MADALRENRGRAAKLTVFPEAALAGYCFDSLEEAGARGADPGPSTERMRPFVGS